MDVVTRALRLVTGCQDVHRHQESRELILTVFTE